MICSFIILISLTFYFESYVASEDSWVKLYLIFSISCSFDKFVFFFSKLSLISCSFCSRKY